MSRGSSVYKNSSKKEYNLTESQRDTYRQISKDSREAKSSALLGLSISQHPINVPNLNPCSLMDQLPDNGLRGLSLFSGGGGLDLGFDRCGYQHVASYDLIPICGDTIRLNRPDWEVYSGLTDGDVSLVDWKKYIGKVDVIHGGPPCQPFSIAGGQKGADDERNMWPEFIRAINTIQPKAFVAENVLGLLNPKFEDFVKLHILEPLSSYKIVRFEINAIDFGVPQIRRRVFFVGFRRKNDFDKFSIPQATHQPNLHSRTTPTLFDVDLPKTMGVRQALGLSDIGFDNFAPTIRSGFTGKRNTTSVLNSQAGQKTWGDMQIWPNGVQESREIASKFPAKNDHFRLSVQDVALIQGFPESWKFSGAVYQVLGQIGNSVAPPVAYNVAKQVALALKA